MSTTDTTIVRYDIITDGGNAASYRDRDPQIVARRDTAGVLSDIDVVVSWGGHEGRATINGSHTLDSLTENAYDIVFGAIDDADIDALASLIRSATAAHTEAADLYTEATDDAAVRADVAAALGEEPHLHIPTTRREAVEWVSRFVPEDFGEIVPA